MSDYLSDYETVLGALERLAGETYCAARYVGDLEDKKGLCHLAAKFVTAREELRKALCDVRDADAVVQANTCTCPLDSRGLPMVIDASCTAYSHGSFAEK
jgi:hypothetical protein